MVEATVLRLKRSSRFLVPPCPGLGVGTAKVSLSLVEAPVPLEGQEVVVMEPSVSVEASSSRERRHASAAPYITWRLRADREVGSNGGS